MDCFAPEFYEKIIEEYLTNKPPTADGRTALATVKLSNNGLKSLENIGVLGDKTLKLNLSGNRISDLSPLRGFSYLIELDLSQNNIESISTLQSLPLLEVLDLSENKIHSLGDISAIRDLPNLRCLRLTGNPICKSLEYPDEIWQLSSSLETIDFFERLSDSRNSITNASKDNQTVFSVQRIKKMEFEIKALTSSLHVQEEMMSREGRENTEELKVHLVNQLLFPDTPPTSSNTPPLSVAEISKSYDEMTQRFPFLRLLTHWRNEAYKSNVRYLLAQDEKHRLSQQHQRDRDKFLHKRKELEAMIYRLESKEKIQREEILLLEEERERLKKQLSHQINKTEEISKQSHQSREGLVSLSKYLISFQRDCGEKDSERVAVLAEKMEEFKDFQIRLDAMKEQMESLGGLLRLRESQLRNSQARLEMERRLLRQPQQPHPLEKKEGEGEGEAIEQKEREGLVSSSDRRLSAVKISNEAESYLKAVFFRLYDQRSQLVPIHVILTALLNIKLDDCSREFEDILSHCSSEGIELRAALQNDDVLKTFFSNLLHLYSAKIDDDVSWGELLLQFLPDIPTNATTSTSFSPLTRQEIRALSQKNVVESIYFSTLPYQLPPPTSATATSSMKQDIEKLYTNHLKQQGSGGRGLEELVQRLRLEKKLLNHQLQQITRQITSTAEMTRAFFESRLTLAENRERKHEEEKILLSEKVLRLEELVQHLSTTNKNLSEKNEEQRQVYLREIAEAERRLEEYRSNENEASQLSSKQLSDLKIQYEQLQLQCKRKDTQTTLLQRQYDRLKVDYERCEKERVASEKKYLHELQALQEKSKEEMTSLRLQLQESQSMLVQSNQKTIELEEERYALTKRLEGIEAEMEEERRKGKEKSSERGEKGETVSSPPLPSLPLPPPRSHALPPSASATSTLSPSLLPRSSQLESGVGERERLSQTRPSILALQQIEQKIARLLNQPPI